MTKGFERISVTRAAAKWNSGFRQVGWWKIRFAFTWTCSRKDKWHETGRTHGDSASGPGALASPRIAPRCARARYAVRRIGGADVGAHGEGVFGNGSRSRHQSGRPAREGVYKGRPRHAASLAGQEF